MQTSQFCIKTLSSMGLSVKNCTQLYTIEKSQMIAVRALCERDMREHSLSCERSLEGGRPRFMEQLHSPQEQGSVSATSSEPMASMHSPLCPKRAAEAPALMIVLHATERQKGHLSQLNDLLSCSFSRNPYTYISFVTWPHLAAREMFSFTMDPSVLPKMGFF